jgi:hypothetical protein
MDTFEPQAFFGREPHLLNDPIGFTNRMEGRAHGILHLVDA